MKRSKAGSATTFFLKSAAVLLSASVFFSPAFPAHAADREARVLSEAGIDSAPSRYGRVIYHKKGSRARIYIVGIGHRDTFTRKNGAKTALIQSEVFRIGESLLRHESIELLLPEGYFAAEGERTPRNPVHKVAWSGEGTAPARESMRDYFAAQEDATAERLLIDRYGMAAGQIEDPALYRAVVEQLGNFETLAGSGSTIQAYYAKADLDYLQDRRTAAMMQKIPEVVEAQFLSGAISRRGAMFTIGVSHLPQIIGWLKQDKLSVPSPAFSRFQDIEQELGLSAKGYDITIILPNSVASDNDLLAQLHLADAVRPVEEAIAENLSPSSE